MGWAAILLSTGGKLKAVTGRACTGGAVVQSGHRFGAFEYGETLLEAVHGRCSARLWETVEYCRAQWRERCGRCSLTQWHEVSF